MSMLDVALAEDRPAISPLRPGDDPTAIAVAGQWSLIWHKFARNKVALLAGAVILAFYLVGIFAEFLAPALPSAARPQYTYAPPQGIAFFVTGEDGRREWLPHVKGYSVESTRWRCAAPSSSIRTRSFRSASSCAARSTRCGTCSRLTCTSSAR